MLERLLRNWPLKLLALGLAFAVWLAVTGDNRVLEVSFDAVPVVFANQEYEATAQPGSVSVVISGPPAVLRTIRREQIRPVADLAGCTPRRDPYSVEVRIEFAGVGAADLALISVKSVSVPRIAVRLSNRRIVT
jgi:YbbR domain-containing protein